MVLCFISHFNRASITSAGDERIMTQFSISPVRMGVVYSAFLVVYTAFMIPGGWFIDRRGPRLALLCMGLGSALFCGVTGAVGFGFIPGDQVWFALLGVRALMGLFNTPLHPGAARAVGNWFPPRQQSLANGLITGASILAYAVVHGVFGAMIDRLDWPSAFVITGGVTAVIAIAWGFFATDVPGTPSATPGPTALPVAAGAPLPEAFHRVPLAWLTLSYATVGYFQYLFFYWIHFYFEHVLRLGNEDSRLLAALPSLAMAIGMPIGGWITGWAEQRFGTIPGRTRVPLVGMIASSMLLAAGVLCPVRLLGVALLTLSLGTLGLCEASFWTMAILLGRRRGGLAAAIMNTGGNAVGLLAPMLAPLLARELGWNWGLGLGALVGVAGALCWLPLARIDSDELRRRPARPGLC